MEWIEVTAKTVEAAVDAALDRLGVDETDVEYEVVEEPRRGLFGLGGTSARIRARVKPISREKPDRRRRTGGRGGESRSGGGRSRPGRSDSRGGDSRVSGERGERDGAGRGESRAKPEDRPATSGRGEGNTSGEERSGTPRRRSRGGGAGRPAADDASRGHPEPRDAAGATPAASSMGTARNRSTEQEEEFVSGYEVPLEEQVELAEHFTRGLVEQFGLDGDVTARLDEEDDVRVDVAGADLGILIGPKAATLDAVQELVRTAVQRRIGGHGARVHVDVSGYRARRQAALADFARDAATRAVESGRDQVFEPMSAADRKVIHDIVNDIDGVATVSEGEEPRRRVVIKTN